jgi:hypothetical protein
MAACCCTTSAAAAVEAVLAAVGHDCRLICFPNRSRQPRQEAIDVIALADIECLLAMFLIAVGRDAHHGRHGCARHC